MDRKGARGEVFPEIARNACAGSQRSRNASPARFSDLTRYCSTVLRPVSMISWPGGCTTPPIVVALAVAARHVEVLAQRSAEQPRVLRQQPDRCAQVGLLRLGNLSPQAGKLVAVLAHPQNPLPLRLERAAGLRLALRSHRRIPDDAAG